VPVRPATPADAEALLPLFRAYCDFYDADPADESLRAMIAAVIAAPDDEAFLLLAEEWEGSGIVGFACCGWKWSSLQGGRIVWLDDLYVASDARGRGHADELIRAVAGVAREGGAPIVGWLTGPENRRAQAVYDRLGGRGEPMVEYELEL
jgi:GNAT superfamily N-acetyltransferase